MKKSLILLALPIAILAGYYFGLIHMRDITDYTIISGVYVENKTTLCVQIVEGSNKEKVFNTLTVDSLDNLTAYALNPAYLGMCKAVIINKNLPQNTADELFSRLPRSARMAYADFNPFDLPDANGFMLWESLRELPRGVVPTLVKSGDRLKIEH